MSYLQKAKEWQAKKKKHGNKPTREKQAKKAAQLLKERGWVAVKSHVLGEVVLWTRDKKVAVPERWSNAVIYTLEELQALVNEPVPSAAELKGIHAAKKIFEGELVNLEHNGVLEKF